MRTALVVLVIMITALIAALLLVGPGASAATGPQHVPVAAAAAVDGWELAWDRARARAAREQRPILAVFTGSDWCPSCIELQRDVLDTPGFRTWAGQRVVLLELDFPQRTAQAADLVAQNEALQRHYAIDGYPTVLLLAADGSELGRIQGLPPGGADAFITRMETLLATRR